MKTLINKNSFEICFNDISKINILNSKDIERQLINIVKIKNSFLILDLSNIKFIDSTGFETLLNLHKTSIINESNIQLIKISEELIELFDLVKLTNIFKLTKN